MPYRLAWHPRALAQFRRLEGLNLLHAARLLGGFPHDNWLTGRIRHSPEEPELEVLILELDTVRMAYTLLHDEEVVRILRVEVID